MNNTFKLGRSITKLVPFHRISIKKQQQKEDPIITNKILYIFGIIAGINIRSCFKN
jgi:hypothetical protein